MICRTGQEEKSQGTLGLTPCHIIPITQMGNGAQQGEVPRPEVHSWGAVWVVETPDRSFNCESESLLVTLWNDTDRVS